MPKMSTLDKENYRSAILDRITKNMPAVMQEYSTINWNEETKNYRTDHEYYPEYIHAPIHGITDNYTNAQNCLSWDLAMDAIIEASHKVSCHDFRTGMVELIPADAKIETVLELGAGTAEGSLFLAQRFPQARFTVSDVSPYMLVIAKHKFEKAGLSERANFEQIDARQTGYASNSFDLVTSSLLFHETPKAWTSRILDEMYRIVKPGGWILYSDTFRGQHALNDSFAEPWLAEFREINFEYEFARAGFENLNYLRYGVGLWYMVGRKPE